MTDVESNVSKIVEALTAAFSADTDQWPTDRLYFTRRVKEVLGDLGKKLQFQVACHKSDYGVDRGVQSPSHW